MDPVNQANPTNESQKLSHLDADTQSKAKKIDPVGEITESSTDALNDLKNAQEASRMSKQNIKEKKVESLPKSDVPVSKLFPANKATEDINQSPAPPLTPQQVAHRENFYKIQTRVQGHPADSYQEYHYTYPIFDPNHLVGGLCEEIFYNSDTKDVGKTVMNLQNLAWMINMAMYSLPDKEALDPITKDAIQFAILNSWRKSAPQADESTAKMTSAQKSPFWQETLEYYRSHSQIWIYINSIFSGQLKIPVTMVDSALILEVFEREHPHPKLKLIINDNDEFKKLIDEILNNLDENSKDNILINISNAIDISQIKHNPDYLKNCFEEFKKIVEEKLEEAQKQDPMNDQRNAQIEALRQKLEPFAYLEHEGQPLIAGSQSLISLIENINLRYGFCPNPEQALKSLIALSGHSAQEVLKTYKEKKKRADFRFMSEARLVTGKERMLAKEFPQSMQQFRSSTSHVSKINAIPEKNETIGTVCEKWEDFTTSAVFTQFENLSRSENASPYLKILPAATAALLKGFNAMNIDEAFKNRGLQEVLQMSYYLMIQAMSEAIFRKNDFAALNSCIELIHQQIQNIFAFVQPYDSKAFSSVLLAEYTTGKDPLIPNKLGNPKVYLKASGMHCTSSILGAVEKLKGTNHLNVVSLKDSYYESTGNLNKAKTYKNSLLDGDLFKKNSADALNNIKNRPVDLFVCEYHHNISISLNKQSYSPELIKEQILALMNNGLAANPMTVAIDRTIHLHDSDDLHELFEDTQIQDFITQGKLNIALYRSAQKFDMLGMDNYYGGIVTVINNGKDFTSFNARMEEEKDQLRGFHYQGLTHIHQHAAPFLDMYRKAIIESTQSFYRKLPSEAIWKQNQTHPLQISEMKDDQLVFIDIKCPNHPKTLQAIRQQFEEFAEDNELLLTKRASFGFTTMNLVNMTTVLRLNPGLEDEKTLDLYAFFFKAIQKEINDHPGITDQELANKISDLKISTTPAAELFDSLKNDSKKTNPVLWISKSKIQDVTYLDIQFESEKILEAFQSAFLRLQQEKHLPQKHTYAWAGFEKTELPVLERPGKTFTLRLNPSQETKENLETYREFFQAIEKQVWENENLGDKIATKMQEDDRYFPGWRISPYRLSIKKATEAIEQQLADKIDSLHFIGS